MLRFMAPEVLSSKVVPASDVWSAGILAYQLLCGSLPFDDRGGSLPKIWKAILTSEPSFSGPAWQDISPEAKDFVRSLLNKYGAATARPALPWQLLPVWAMPCQRLRLASCPSEPCQRLLAGARLTHVVCSVGSSKACASALDKSQLSMPCSPSGCGADEANRLLLWRCISQRQGASNSLSMRLADCREVDQRPTAREALQHPWLRSGGDEDRGKGTPLSHTVIQRIQVRQYPKARKHARRITIPFKHPHKPVIWHDIVRHMLEELAAIIASVLSCADLSSCLCSAAEGCLSRAEVARMRC